jgi:regulatory factor X, other
MPRFQADSALIPSEEQSTASPVMPSRSLAEPDIRVFPVPQDPVYAPNRPTATMTHPQRMKFASYHIMEANDKTDIVLPDITPYIPPKTDADAANALATLYLTHVTNLVDCVRFCREKQFFRLFTSFQGTLTVPVQKLLVHPDVAPWVKECDYLMYQKMIKVIAPLTLQVMPAVVMKFFDAVSKLLDDHITKTFEGLPRHVLDAKLESSTIFGQLLQRMLRANQSAHAAGAILIDEETRNRMWTEWVRFVNPKCMMTAIIPDCGYDRDVYNLLTHDVRALLLPLSTDPNLERGTHYEISAVTMNSRPQPAAFELDRMGNFLEGMKSRYAKVPSRDLLHYIHGVTGHALRDITMENGSSYNCWLITKCFVDELTLWLVHAGGFLERRVPAVPSSDQAVNNGSAGFLNETNGGSNGGEGSGSHSRYSSLGSEFEPSAGNTSDFQSNSMRAAQNLQAHSKSSTRSEISVYIYSRHPVIMQSHPNSSYTMGTPTLHRFATSFSAAPNGSRPSTAGGQSTDVDDSGIGLSLLDDDFDMKPSNGLQKQFTSSTSSLRYTTTAGPDAMVH